MASLTKTTILEVAAKDMLLMVEQIHPDAWPFTWLDDQSQEDLDTLVLTRILKVLEKNDRTQSAFYQEVFNRAKQVMEEETIDLDAGTELSEYGYLLYEAFGKDLITQATMVEKDFNDNWAKGLVKNFHPFKTEGFGLPFVKFKVGFLVDVLEPEMAGLYDCTYLDIADLS